MEKRTYAASDQTKHALAAALKELIAQKPIDKITIHDITERCGIRRQNFYYHFEDVYDLMRWMFQEEAMSLCASMRGRCCGRRAFCSSSDILRRIRRCACAPCGRWAGSISSGSLRRTSTPSSTAR